MDKKIFFFVEPPLLGRSIPIVFIMRELFILLKSIIVSNVLNHYVALFTKVERTQP